jgi:hypothetical protein
MLVIFQIVPKSRILELPGSHLLLGVERRQLLKMHCTYNRGCREVSDVY